MIVRIVKMTFIPEKAERFIALFNLYKLQISNADGCLYLQLLRDTEKPHVFFTYSYWSSVQCLNNYRNSSLFKEVWPATTALFAEKPEVWSTVEMYKKAN